MKLKDIAEELGISMATVSMVLNNRPGISQQTRMKVLEVVRNSNYKAPYLKEHAEQISNVINLIIFRSHGKVATFDTPFFSDIIESIQNHTKKLGFQLMVLFVNINDPQYEHDIEMLTQQNCIGTILLATEMEKKDFAGFEMIRTPLVVLDNALVGVSCNKVLINNYEGAYKAVRFLFRKGHRQIGHLKSSIRIKNFDERLGGFMHAIREFGLSSSSLFTVELNSDLEGSYHDMCTYLQKSPVLPTAFFADNDYIAMGALKALKQFSIEIPNRVSLIGFDDMPFCTICDPALTTMRVHKTDIGKIAVNRIVDLQQSDDNYCLKQEIDTEIIERASVKNLCEDNH
jgi:LacI family transcriptional regulator